MTTNRAASGGVLPPQKAIELLEKCANEGRERLRSYGIDREQRVGWSNDAAHCTALAFGKASDEYSSIVLAGKGAPMRVSGEEFDRWLYQRQVTLLDGFVRNLKRILDLGTSAAGPIAPTASAPQSNKVFVVHGHDHGAKEAVARRILELGLKPIILHEQPNGGKTVIEKIERNADVGFAVVLLTDDDVGAAKQDRKRLLPRARQNVILELGFFFGKLGRDRVFALRVDGVEMPSDTLGIVYEPFTIEGGAWRSKLAQELRAAGLPVKADA